MENRNYILDRLKSKTVTVDEFNYDRLQAPPISAMFTQEDIAKLNYIAKSLKYSAKPQIKYQEIDKIMRSRGFEKFIGGTNRIIYRPIEDNRFIVKVAYDAVGLGDNPREYKNQFIFKPFVTKVFEITPCGTLGVFERVIPITSREEFLSVANDIYSVINEWFIGEYVMEDIGSKFFMNWGIRKGFGPVLLDFPYVYKLDGDKLFCNAPSNKTPSGCCEGVIDYDDGYNFLYCTKCGVRYKAKELEKAIENDKVIVKSKGEIKMKIKLSGGSKNVNKEVVTGKYSEMAKAVPTNKPIKGRSEKMSNKKMKEINKKKDIEKEEEKEVIVKDEEKTITSTKTYHLTSPVRFVENTSFVDEFNDKLLELSKMIDHASDKDKETINELIYECFKDQIDKAASEKVENKKEVKRDQINDLASLISDDLFEDLLHHIFGDSEEEIYDELIRSSLKDKIDNGSYSVSFKEGEISWGSTTDGEEMIGLELYPRIMKSLGNSNHMVTVYEREKPIILGLKPEDIDIALHKGGLIIVSQSELDDNNKKENTSNNEVNEIGTSSYGDLKYFAGTILSQKDIYPDKQPGKILTLVDENGQYLTFGKDNNIIAVDMIDNKSLNSLSLVSSNWLDNIVKAEGKTGVVAPSNETPISVNGVPTTEEE